MEQQTAHRFTWQSIEIEVIYTQRRLSVIDHLSNRSINPERAPLPITSTGYRSHFMQLATIDAYGGDVVAQVTASLDDEAAKPAWRAHADVVGRSSLSDPCTAIDLDRRTDLIVAQHT